MKASTSRQCRHGKRTTHGFTLIELMIVVAIIGILASVAIPNFARFQLRAKTAESKSNLAAILTAEEAYFSEYGRYVGSPPEPPVVPGTTQQKFAPVSPGFITLGFQPEGPVYFSYTVALSVAADDTGFTANAAGDIDGNGVIQYWAVLKEAGDNTRAPSPADCDVTTIPEGQVMPCSPNAGQSVF